jgi:putative ABC transport system permease protein
MNALSYLPLVVRSALRNRRRSVLTLASLAVSLGLLGVLLALARTLFYGGETTPGQARRLVVHHKIALTQDLPLADEPKIQQLQGVRAVTSVRWFGGTYKDPRDSRNQFAQFAIEPRTLFEVYPELQMPDTEQRAFISLKTACVASRALAGAQNWKPGERITLVGTITPATLELTLAGIFDAPAGGGAVLFFNSEYLRDSLRAGDDRRDMVQQFYVETDSTDAVSNVARHIDDTFADSPSPTKSEPEQAFLLSFVSFLGNLKLFLAAICGAVAFTILLVSANMLSMSVRERTREVGVLKTLGFSPGEILGLVVGEASFIALAGGVLGCVLAGALCTGLGVAMSRAQGFASALEAPSVTPLIAILTLAIALFIGLASSVVPGVNAARASILDALGYTG